MLKIGFCFAPSAWMAIARRVLVSYMMNVRAIHAIMLAFNVSSSIIPYWFSNVLGEQEHRVLGGHQKAFLSEARR